MFKELSMDFFCSNPLKDIQLYSPFFVVVVVVYNRDVFAILVGTLIVFTQR